jgi:hypothetical protein
LITCITGGSAILATLKGGVSKLRGLRWIKKL